MLEKILKKNSTLSSAKKYENRISRQHLDHNPDRPCHLSGLAYVITYASKVFEWQGKHKVK